MKRALIIISIYCFVFTTKTNCQVTGNAYEVEIDKLLSEKNPEYYNGLRKTLSEFQQELITKGLIQNGTYQSYVELLKRISEEDKLNFVIEYDLEGKLKELGNGISKIIPSMETTLIAGKYLNIENSKDFVFTQKISEMKQNDKKLSRSILAKILLEVYDKKDFELLMIKLRIFRFIDPNMDLVVYVYAGRPNPK